jgi:SAM-dependent methyltransferase
MRDPNDYLMENPEEAVRLDVKTDVDAVRQQGVLCGIGPGARVLDGGCGSGKTTTVLHSLVQPGGQAVGVEFAQDRIEFARRNYENGDGIEFHQMDLRGDLSSLGAFDSYGYASSWVLPQGRGRYHCQCSEIPEA